ncbi:MAG: hypothetical protein HYY06_28690 [Deltaproteobacteria bacterium]|nr:hypothetical protein [Deltaproteobacteria bacterium]
MAAKGRILGLAAVVVAATLVAFPLLSGLAGGGPTAIVYMESGADDDRTRIVVEGLVVPQGEEPDRQVFQITHERGFMPRGVLSPDGNRVALVRQPKGVTDREGAEAIVLETSGNGAGVVTVLPVPAFGLSTPVFPPTGNDWVYVTSAALASPAPEDEEMRSGHLAEYVFTIHQVQLSNYAVSTRLEQRLAYLHPIGVGKVLVAPRTVGEALLVYRVTHGGGNVAWLNIFDHEPPTVLANLGFAMARSFDLTDSRDALIFSSSDPGEAEGRIQALYLSRGGLPVQLGGPVPREASPIWAGTSRNWFFSRVPDGRGGDTPQLPMQLFHASDRQPTGVPLDSLSAMTGLAPAAEVPIEGGASPGGRFVAVRANTEEGMVHLLRDTVDPESARTLGEGQDGVIRILGFR